MNRIEAYNAHYEATPRTSKAYEEGLPTAILIGDAMDDLVDMNCPYCHSTFCLPSLEDIQEWLKEEK